MKENNKLNNGILDLGILAKVTAHLREHNETKELIEIAARIQNSNASEFDKNIIDEELVRLGRYIEEIPNAFELHRDGINLKVVYISR